MKILITGAEGFIGQHLTDELRAVGTISGMPGTYDRRHVLSTGFTADHTVIGVDRADGDLLEPGVARDLIGKHAPDVVIHLAAQVGRLFGEDDLLHTVKTNVGMTALVAKACADAGCRLAYASTSEVYGDQGDAWLSEEMPVRTPHNLYGVTKYAGEEVCRLYVPDATILRLSMPYGPGLPHGRGRAAIINFLWNAAHGQQIDVHRGAERCWCWVGDTVRGIRLIIEHECADFESGHGIAKHVWNVGRGDNATSMFQTALLALQLVGSHSDHPGAVAVDPPGMQTVVKRLSDAKLRSIGWQPEVELVDGMRLTARAMGLEVYS